ncbi:MAG: hypothetical protein KC496_11890 [Anaerolineae bacterium]|nr:hypothetical protein [Anaerolineae bacterium]
MVLDTALHQFLVLYMWFPLAALLGFFLLIARFYQRFSMARTYYLLYIVAAIGFGALSIRQASVELVRQDWVSGVVSFLSGLFLAVAVLILARLMLGAKEVED